MSLTIILDVEGLRGTLKFIEFKFCEKSSLLNNFVIINLSEREREHLRYEINCTHL